MGFLWPENLVDAICMKYNMKLAPWIGERKFDGRKECFS